MVILVVKASGETEPLDLNKVRKACLNSGVSSETAEEIVKKISQSAYDGISTKEIYKQVYHLLEKFTYGSALRYRLKEAIMRMGPSGFPFETYLSIILKQYGYRTRTGLFLKGECADHEVDIIAEEDFSNRTAKYLVECKYHNASGIYTGLKEALYTYARFLDLKEGSEKGFCERLDGVWLATNTKISSEAEKYCKCRGLRLIGWKIPSTKGLEKLIEEKNLYPVTILKSVDNESLKKLSKAGIMLTKDLQSLGMPTLWERTRIPRKKLWKILDDLERIKQKEPR